MPKNISVEESVLTDTFGRFVIQPLERGYGVTIGNSLRRVLISSLPGTAIVAIRINDLTHEFTTIKGVAEDLTEVILNLKELRFKDITKKSNKIDIKIKGAGEFTAKDIQKNTSDFEILNPEKFIATLNKDADLNIELRLGTGVGYVPSEENKQQELPLGFISIDSIFSPIKNVTYNIENTRVAQRTDYEKLIMEVTTDGSMTPEEAVVTAGQILNEHIQLFINLKPETQVAEVIPEVKDEEFERVKKILIMPVDELDLSVRSQNCLRAANIKTLGELVSKDESEMLHYRNFGRKSLAELEELVESFGLNFGMDVNSYLNETNGK
jgi:DNA-directed RNA polymerase subunit alpha